MLDLHIKNNAICRSILKTISKLRDQISLSSVHSKFVGHSTEIIRQSKIKGPLHSSAKDDAPYENLGHLSPSQNVTEKLSLHYRMNAFLQVWPSEHLMMNS